MPVDTNWDGFQSATIPANRYQQMFINGYLDVSGRTIIRNGDLSLNSGRLFVAGDTSLNGNVQVGGNLLVNGGLIVKQMQTANIINMTTTNYQMIVTEDISLNGRLFVSGNVGIGSGSPSCALDVVGGMSLANNFSGNSTEYTPNTTSANNFSWYNNDIYWTSSASTTAVGDYYNYRLYDTTTTGGWVSQGGYTNGIANTTTGSLKTSFKTTEGSNPIEVYGQYMQLECSTPLVIKNYSFTTADNSNPYPSIPKEFYILGSNDGTTWYAIQKGTVTNTGATVSNLTASAVITVNQTYSGNTQNFYGVSAGTSKINTTTYASYTTAAYTYFRILVNSVIGNDRTNVYLYEVTLKFTSSTKTSSTLSMDTSKYNQLNVKSRATFTGKVGIGSDNPTVPLDIASSSVGLRIASSSAGNSGPGISLYHQGSGGVDWRLFSTGTAESGSTAGRLSFYSQTTGEVMCLNGVSGTGKVGIGSAAPTVALDVVGSTKLGANSKNISCIQFGIGSGSSTGTITFTSAFPTIPIVVASVNTTSSNLLTVCIGSITTTSFAFSKNYITPGTGSGGGAGESFFWIAISS